VISNHLRFRDLKSRGIVSNWPTLNAWIAREGFPAGRLVGPNTRLWDEVEVAAWLEARDFKRRALEAVSSLRSLDRGRLAERVEDAVAERLQREDET
jgi:hypothetical protein